MRRTVLSRLQAPWVVAAIVVLANCGSNPAAPTPAQPGLTPVSVGSVTPAAPVRNDVAQVLHFAGAGFRPGLVLKITDPTGLLATVPSVDIQNLVPTSFQASVILSKAGRYGFVVQQQDGETSGSFWLGVLNTQAVTAQIDDISPSLTVTDDLPQRVVLIGANFTADLTLHIVDPDNLLTDRPASDLMIEGDSVLLVMVVFNKTGTYTFSLWNAGGAGSNSSQVRVR